jgi:hypothetical protein
MLKDQKNKKKWKIFCSFFKFRLISLLQLVGKVFVVKKEIWKVQQDVLIVSLKDQRKKVENFCFVFRLLIFQLQSVGNALVVKSKYVRVTDDEKATPVSLIHCVFF